MVILCPFSFRKLTESRIGCTSWDYDFTTFWAEFYCVTILYRYMSQYAWSMWYVVASKSFLPVTLPLLLNHQAEVICHTCSLRFDSCNSSSVMLGRLRYAVVVGVGCQCLFFRLGEWFFGELWGRYLSWWWTWRRARLVWIEERQWQYTNMYNILICTMY